jgi:GT2 family glycosyltransferase
LVTDNASAEPVDDLVGNSPGLSVTRLSENLGPAGGYAHALTAFLDSPFAWAWVMDDDCVPDPDALETLLEMTAPNRVVLPTVRWEETGAVVRGHGWWGALIPRSVVEQVGVPNADLFWWTEDTEYLQWRIPQAGNEVRWSDRPVIEVTRGRPDGSKPAWKYYYEVRNQIHHRLRVQQPGTAKPVPRHLRFRVRSWRAFRSTTRLGLRVVFREHDEKSRKFAMVLRGAADGVRGRLGRTVAVDDPHRPLGPGERKECTS